MKGNLLSSDFSDHDFLMQSSGNSKFQFFRTIYQQDDQLDI